MVSVDEKMERAHRTFSERASRADTAEERTLCEELAEMADAMQETVRQLDHVKGQLDEMRRALGLHLETSGIVPHTQRRRAGREVVE